MSSTRPGVRLRVRLATTCTHSTPPALDGRDSARGITALRGEQREGSRRGASPPDVYVRQKCTPQPLTWSLISGLEGGACVRMRALLYVVLT